MYAIRSYYVIDHPWAGFAGRTGVIVDLNKHLPKEFLQDQAANSVGKSHESYNFDGYQSALAIDAATPVGASRPDLLPELPKTWDDLVELAKKGQVAIPGIPQDTLMSFYMVCCTLGEDVALSKEYFVSEEIGLNVITSYSIHYTKLYDSPKVQQTM